jgi:hypothetical protein
MTVWAESLLPVGSLIAGSMMTMAGQVLTDRRQSRRESDKRRDDFRLRRYETERETLLALQDAIDKHILSSKTLLAAVRDAYGDWLQPEPFAEVLTFAEREFNIEKLAARCLDREAAEATLAFIKRAGAYAGEKAGATSPEKEYQHAQELLGRALRKDLPLQ